MILAEEQIAKPETDIPGKSKLRMHIIPEDPTPTVVSLDQTPIISVLLENTNLEITNE